MGKTLLKAEIIGHVGSVRSAVTGSGTSVLNLTVAHNRRRGDDEETEWVDVALWGKLADAVEQYIDKGVRIYASGEARTRTYEHKGEFRAAMEITARDFVILSSAEDKRGGPRKSQEKSRPRQKKMWEDEDDSDW